MTCKSTTETIGFTTANHMALLILHKPHTNATHHLIKLILLLGVCATDVKTSTFSEKKLSV